MTKAELKKVTQLSSGTIANITGVTKYEELDEFINWLYRPVSEGVVMGETVYAGHNALSACMNAYCLYQRVRLNPIIGVN